MLLFQKRFHAGLVSGDVRLTFRRWQKPHVKVGGRYRCHPIGVLEVDAVSRVPVSAIGAADARASGFADREALLAYLAEVPGAPPLTSSTLVFRVALRHVGDGDRIELALAADLDDAAVAEIGAKLAKLDAKDPWTAEALRAIARRPRVAASQLAAELGRETLPFKVLVRKLKRLGLTQSFEVGYELSPRGAAYLARAARKRAAKRPAVKR